MNRDRELSAAVREAARHLNDWCDARCGSMRERVCMERMRDAVLRAAERLPENAEVPPAWVLDGMVRDARKGR